jgi:sigma-54-specific transcriptional regulator
MTLAKVLVHPQSSATPHLRRAKALIFADPKSRQLLEQIEQVAPSEAPVLLAGESGTGKELIARHLHEHSGRSGPFLAVNCGALSESLAEAELFGHQAGAFTGAIESRAGWFEAAHAGTLFLDEIGDLPLSLQVKLLRVLQEREVTRLGARKPVPVDVRIIAATNVDLAAAVAAGRFRLDLYYRLNVARFELAPLRARRDDIAPLVDHFLNVYAARLRRPVPRVSAPVLEVLQNYPWPGNIRELENVIHFAVLFAKDGVIQPHDLRFTTAPAAPAALQASGSASAETGNPLQAIGGYLDRLFGSPPDELFAQLEELTMKRAFDFCGGNQVQTARMLGISRNVLRTYLKRFSLIGVHAEDVATA